MSEALGVALKSDLDDGCAVLEVLVVAKVMDSDGTTMLFQSCSEGLRTWEAVGMATGLLDQLRKGLDEMFSPDEED